MFFTCEIGVIQIKIDKDQQLIFVDRRNGKDRRFDVDPCKDMKIDLHHRKRRKSAERRDTSKNLVDDYYAFTQSRVSKHPLPEKSSTEQKN